MKKIAGILILVTALLLALSSCTSGGDSPALSNPDELALAGEVSPARSSAWIDAPLNGMVLPLEPYMIVYHASDPAGVAQVELTANGVLLSSEGSAGAMELLTLRYEWLPPASGEYVLQAREQNASGAWSEIAEVVVIITSGTITPTLTQTSTPTITSTLTHTPTETQTPTATATQPSELALINPFRSTTTLFYGGCEPGSLTLMIQATLPEEVEYMYLFYKLQDKDTGEQTASSGGSWMTKTGVDTWTITLQGAEIQNDKKYDDAWFIYQFISQGPDKELTRSQQYSDVTLAACSSGVPAEPVIPTPFIMLPD